MTTASYTEDKNEKWKFQPREETEGTKKKKRGYKSKKYAKEK